MMNLSTLALLTCFICQTEANCVDNYFFLNELHTFADARVRCKELGYTDLAVVDSPEKADLAKKILQERVIGNKEFWIGLKYNTTSRELRWIDKTPVGWTHWVISASPYPEPDNMDRDHCVRIKPNSSYRWGTWNCVSTKNALCQGRGVCTDTCCLTHFVLHAVDVDSVDQSRMSFHNVWSRVTCSFISLRHCCSYFLYDNTTCILFPSTLQLDVAILRPGAAIYRII